jgi:hypothetical protein
VITTPGTPNTDTTPDAGSGGTTVITSPAAPDTGTTPGSGTTVVTVPKRDLGVAAISSEAELPISSTVPETLGDSESASSTIVEEPAGATDAVIAKNGMTLPSRRTA